MAVAGTPGAPLQEFRRARDFLISHRADYDTAVAHFVWPRLDRFNWAIDYFDAVAEGNNQPALITVAADGAATRRTFEELRARSSRTANWLRALGVARGDRLLVMLGNEPSLWDVMLAAMKLGAVVIPATPQLTTDDLADRFERGRVAHVVASPSNTTKFDSLRGQAGAPAFTRVVVGDDRPGWRNLAESGAAAADFAADGVTNASDPLLLYFTSGTTARPKLVLHTHESYPVGHLSTMYWIGLRPGDVHWNISSPGWAKHAWSCLFAPWNAGATVFTLDYARFDAPLVLDALGRFDVTTLCAPPTVWRLLIQSDLGSRPRALREVVSAGEPLNPEVIEQVQGAWGLTIRDGFGQTETTAQVGNPPGVPVKPGSMGRALPGFRIVLLDASGQPSDEGELAINLSQRPTGLMTGYLDDPDRTDDAMRHGFYRTGDLASRDENGYITSVGRGDDVFKSSDYRISPFELESALIEHPAVAEAAVVPCPDPLRLSIPKAFVVLAAGSEPTAAVARDIFAFVRRTLAPYKRIRRHRVLRAAQDDLRKDPPGGAANARASPRGGRCSAGR